MKPITLATILVICTALLLTAVTAVTAQAARNDPSDGACDGLPPLRNMQSWVVERSLDSCLHAHVTSPQPYLFLTPNGSQKPPFNSLLLILKVSSAT